MTEPIIDNSVIMELINETIERNLDDLSEEQQLELLPFFSCLDCGEQLQAMVAERAAQLPLDTLQDLFLTINISEMDKAT